MIDDDDHLTLLKAIHGYRNLWVYIAIVLTLHVVYAIFFD